MRLFQKPVIGQILQVAKLLLFSFCVVQWSVGQSVEFAGRILDPTGLAISEAEIVLSSKEQGFEMKTHTDTGGRFRFAGVGAGAYKLTVAKEGFASAIRDNVDLHVGGSTQLDITLPLASTSQSVRVEGSEEGTEATGALSSVVDQRLVSSLPLNGRSFSSLLELSPGVTLANRVSAASPGQFSVNGQRTDSNYFMVDGVSANVSTSSGGQLGQASGGSSPATTVLGGLSNLVSIDSLQEFRVMTSSFAPEYGRSPGAQIMVQTRSGTNSWHGSAFEYLRNEKLDANDWFANQSGLPRQALRQNDFGGVLGGPIVRDRLFFFVSQENVDLRQPQTVVSAAPSLEIRESAPSQLKPLLALYPLPNGPVLSGGQAQFLGSFSLPSSMMATSGKLDYVVSNRWLLFARYSGSPSSTTSRNTGALNTTTQTEGRTDSITVASTWITSPRTVNESRFNVTRVSAGSTYGTDSLGGADPAALASLTPNYQSPNSSVTRVAFLGLGVLQQGTGNQNTNNQVNLIHNFSRTGAAHTLKFGVDWRLLIPTLGQPGNLATFELENLSQPLTPLATVELDAYKRASIRAQNLGLYAQDLWKIGKRVSLTYGVRWDLNPAPVGRRGTELYRIGGLDTPQSAYLDTADKPLWNTRFSNVAPRVGVAIALDEHSRWILRGGGGLFFDSGNGIAANAASSIGNSATTILRNVSLPVQVNQLAPPAITTAPPFEEVYAFDSQLKTPRTTQWNVTLDHAIGRNGTMSSSYVGALGRNLYFQQTFQSPNPAFDYLFVTNNAGQSNYQSLQLQYQQRIRDSVRIQAGYTWGHSIDNASSDATENLPALYLSPNLQRGNSDFDLRHSFSLAGLYTLGGTLGRWFGPISFQGIFRARSGFPLDINTGTDPFNQGIFSGVRPDLIEGAPIYIDDPSVPGGRKLNPTAFMVPLTPRQGSLGRNVVRGFGASQLDLSVSRRIKITERVSFQIRADAFNLLNQANFGDPNGNLSSGTFGVATTMLGRSYVAGGSGVGLSPLYQVGGPRSLQIAARLEF